jgi:hypothetical protein
VPSTRTERAPARGLCSAAAGGRGGGGGGGAAAAAVEDAVLVDSGRLWLAAARRGGTGRVDLRDYGLRVYISGWFPRRQRQRGGELARSPSAAQDVGSIAGRLRHGT